MTPVPALAAPRLPPNAPFSAGQRAWLDGFIAGFFAGAGEPAATAPAAADLRVAPSDDEDFPWHDPSLPLDERLALAADGSREHHLMAAMAQLDCGQCGYLCRTYAEAIARGDEESLTRCVPGGKATARKLKELAAAGAALPALSPNAAAIAPTAAASPAEVAGSAFEATFFAARPLNAADSEKDTRHVVLELAGGEDYEPGDSLGVLPRNPPDLVAAIVERLRASPETPVLSPDGIERPLAAALAEACELRAVSDQAIEVLASRARNRDESRVLQAMAEGYPGAGPDDADLLDLLDIFPSARPPLSELISALDPLRPRLYSIASSTKAVGREVHLAVAAVRYDKRRRRRLGVASTFLSDRVAPGAPVSTILHRSPGFRLPASSDAPVIMIGPGTGVAPFRAFLQERRALGAQGRNWLFFGNPRQRTDFLFADEFDAYRRDGLLTRLDTAFSRDQEHKIYVQHRMLEHARELWSWLDEGAYLYLCGDAQKMARDVETALAYIVAKESRADSAAAKAWLGRLAAEGRFQKDVY
jgi:sulfite reductase (NADPH) flavoprotein alpha-component